MAHYRKIDVAIWNDEKFSSMRNGAKFAYLFLLTCPSMTALGAMRASIAGMVDESGASQKDFKEVFDKGLALFDEKSKSLFVPNFLRYQAPEKMNPNIVKGWVRQAGFIPESFIKELALRNVLFYIKDLSPAFREGFNEQFAKDSGGIFEEVYGEFFSKDSSSSFGKIIGFLSERFVHFFTKPVSSKQLAVSKPPYLAIDEIVKPLVVDKGEAGEKTPAEIDRETGEVVAWAA